MISILVKTNMSDINDLITDYKTFQEYKENIIIGNFEYHGKSFVKADVYNNELNEELQKIWIKGPKIKVNKNCYKISSGNNHSKSPLYILLSNRNEEAISLNKFITDTEKFLFNALIKKLNRYVSYEMVLKKKAKKKKHRTNWANSLIMKSSISQFNKKLSPTMKLNMKYTESESECREFDFKIYNRRNKLMKLSAIKKGSYVIPLFELSEVFLNEISIGFNWNILALKTEPLFLYSSTNIFPLTQKEKDRNKSLKEKTECYHCLHCPNNRTHMCSGSGSSNNNASLMMPPPPPPMIDIKPKPRKRIDLSKIKEENKKKNNFAQNVGISLKDILNTKGRLRSVKKKDSDESDKLNSKPNEESDTKKINDVKDSLKDNDTSTN